MRQQREGYILVLTLTITGLLVILGVQIYYLSSGFSSFARIAIKREKAKSLALSGIQLTQNQLYVPPQKKENKNQREVPSQQGKNQKKEAEVKKEPQEPAESQQLILLKQVLPLINRWQKIKFDKKKDGFSGELNTYIACEDGKLHLNNLLSLMAQKGLTEDRLKSYRDLWLLLGQASDMKKGLYESVVEFFERRNRIWVNDVTELLIIPSFKVFANKVFVNLPNSEKIPLYLTDIFTPQSRYGKLDPWVLSVSMQTILGLKSNVLSQDEVGAMLKEFKSSHNWKNDWNRILKPVYGKDFNELPKGIELMLSPRFDPGAFSVVSYGVVDDIVQGVYVILGRKAQDDGSILFGPVKSYWIN